jgi:hypothetical protein
MVQKPLFEVYLCVTPGKPFPWSVSRTHHYDSAVHAFSELVNCHVFDRTEVLVVLRKGTQILAVHRFADEAGMHDHWRGRSHSLLEIPQQGTRDR